MNKPLDLNIALLEALGVQWQSKDILGVTLRMRGGRSPTLTVHRLLTKDSHLGEVIEHFELTPINKG